MRVSTEDQHLYKQRGALEKVGCEKLFEDTASGACDDRPGLAQALSHLRYGDCLVVGKLDRLGRRMVSLIGFVEELQRRGVGFRVLDGGFPIDTTTAQGSSSFTSPPHSRRWNAISFGSALLLCSSLLGPAGVKAAIRPSSPRNRLPWRASCSPTAARPSEPAFQPIRQRSAARCRCHVAPQGVGGSAGSFPLEGRHPPL